MTEPGKAKSRGEMLKQLREEHSENVARTQAMYKEQRRIQQEICKQIRVEPKIVPDIAAAVGLPARDVLWHLMAMKKYGIVVEKGMCGDYPLYLKVEEKAV